MRRVIDWRCAHEDGGEGEKNEELHGSLVMKSLHDTAAREKIIGKKNQKCRTPLIRSHPTMTARMIARGSTPRALMNEGKKYLKIISVNIPGY